MIYHREYNLYKDYIAAQGYKAVQHMMYVVNGNHKRTDSFFQQFKRYRQHLIKGGVLCLGARTGCEVRAFEKHGFDVAGIDLHPLSNLVMAADWHYIPFVDNTFENVFTNSLDHCLDFEKLVGEIKRVLTKRGVFVFQTHSKYAFDSRIEGDEVEDMPTLLRENKRHTNNSMFWDSLSDIINKFIGVGFFLLHSTITETSSTVFLKKE